MRLQRILIRAINLSARCGRGIFNAELKRQLKVELAQRYGGKRSPKKSPPLSLELQVSPKLLRRLHRKRCEIQEFLGSRPVTVSYTDRTPRTTPHFQAPNVEGYMAWADARPVLHPRRTPLIGSRSKLRWTVVVDSVPWASYTCVQVAMQIRNGFRLCGQRCEVQAA